MNCRIQYIVFLILVYKALDMYQCKSEDGSDVVASLTDDSVVIMQSTSAWYMRNEKTGYWHKTKKETIMKNKRYITDEEHKKCRKVADAFADLENEDIDIVVADAGRYGFVRLLYYDEYYGFDKAVCYTDSTALFNDLWKDWLNGQLFQIALENPSLMDLDYEDIFRSLPEEKQEKLMSMRQYYAQKSGITNA